MICLGIESTAHTFGVGIVKNKKILANVKDLYTTESGGLIPSQLAEHHVAVASDIVNQALDEAKISIKDVDLISFSQSPGIGNALRIGAMVARTLATKYNKPLIGVNHCIAHLEIARLQTKAKDPVLLYASGANTQIIAYLNGKYRIFGETLDNGVGNMIDGFARHLGLGFPGGPKVEQLALKGKQLIQLPYVVKGMDISVGGLQTNLRQKADSKKYTQEDLCYSLQETLFAMLTEITERALAHCKKTEVVLGGGVACNKRLQDMITKMCNDRGAQAYMQENQFYVDNGAMIAWTGLLQHKAGGSTSIEEALVKPNIRTDQVDVYWRNRETA